MKKIVKAIFVNFQSHKYNEVDFADFTAIIGPSDSGKTAMLRGIKWALRNEPSGVEFIRRENVYGDTPVIQVNELGEEVEVYPVVDVKVANRCAVILMFNDGTSITRERGNKGNFYELTNAEGEVTHLESFGVGPVKEVMEFHGMRDVDFFGQKEMLNIADQLAPPFFLAESPATRAAMIGKLGNTDVIDAAMNNTLSEIRQKKAVVREHKKQISKIKEDLKDMKDITKMESELAAFKKAREEVQRLTTEYVQLNKLKTQHDQLSRDKERLELVIGREAEINALLTDIEQIISSQAQLAQLKRLNNTVRNQRTEKAKLEAIINKANLEEIEQVIKDLDIVLGAVREVSAATSLNRRIKSDKEKLKKMDNVISYENVIQEAYNELCSAQEIASDTVKLVNINKARKQLAERKRKGEEVIVNLQRDFDTKLKKYKDALLQNPRCPVCMSETSKEKIESIKDII